MGTNHQSKCNKKDKKEKIPRVITKKPKIDVTKGQAGFETINQELDQTELNPNSEFNPVNRFNFINGEDNFKKATANKKSKKSTEVKVEMNNSGSNSGLLTPSSAMQSDLLIHGGFGVKNPEYEALNNDIDLFNAVEIVEDAENKYKCKICQKSFKHLRNQA